MTRALLFRIDTDRSGNIVLEEDLTLEGLRRRIEVAIFEGFSPDLRIMFGYSPDHISAGLVVEKPEDLTKLDFEDLRRRAIKNNAETSVPAWDEIQRRVEAYDEREHLALEGKA